MPVHPVRARLLLLCALCFPSGLSLSQEEGEKDSVKYEIEQVTTIGTRSMERIIDIPYSVFRVDKKELSFGRRVSAKDVLADVPGLFLQSRYGNHDLRMSIRGFGTRSNSGARSVRILLDGIPESDPDGETVLDAIDFTSLGGVEVIKGNLSSLYANAPGGVINFMSDLYFLKSFAGATSQAGEFGLQQHGAKVGLQNNYNRVYFTYVYSNLAGFRQHGGEYQHLVNFAYEAFLTDQSTISVLGNFVDGSIKLPGPLTEAEFLADPYQANPLAVSQDFKRITQKGRLGLRYNTTFGEERNNELELTMYGASKDLERTDNEFYTFATRRTIGGWTRFTHRSRISGQSNTLTLGVDFAHQSGPVTDFDNVNGVKGISVQNEFTESLANVGVFVVDRISAVEDKLDIVLSGRFDRNIFRRDIFIPFGFTDTTRSFHKFAPKVGLNYKLGRSVALYSSYGLSFDIPALSEMGNSPLSSSIKYSLNPDLSPQKSRNAEFGIKGNVVNAGEGFPKKLFFDVTLFHFIIEEEIIPFVVNQRTFYRNAARTRRTGIETGIKCEPVERIEIVVNYTFTHFRYDDYVATVYTPSGITTENYTGNTVPAVPQSILNFILNYELELSGEFSGLIQWDCDYISRMFTDDANLGSSPAYFYGNIMGGVHVVHEPFNTIAFVGVRNLFDRRYAGFINVNDFLGRYYETGEPRTVYGGIKVSCAF